MSQDLHYKILSELYVEAPDGQGVRVVQQAVLDTRLIRADQLSQATFAGSLRELKGSRFRFKVNARGDVSELAANPKGGRQAVAVEQQGNKGFLMTSVMDPDGWKEVAEWTFFAPPAQNNGSLPWSRRITHDYGPLGSWYGETQFRRSASQNGLLRIDFAHQLAYQPPAKDTGSLPFAIKSASLRPEVAGGVIDFDSRVGRIAAVQERFVLKGTINTELVGQEAAIELAETQNIVVRLFESHPWK
jgi:hypothetical protein